jgi:hypothetical protein
MTNLTGSKLSIFSHPGKITVIGLLQDHFHIEAHIGPGQYGPRPRLGPIWGSRDDNQANMDIEMPMY